MTADGRPHWFELNTWDPEKAKTFYAESFGWTFMEMPVPNAPAYILCKSGEDVVAGIFTLTSPFFDGATDMWLTYFAVEDIDARIEQVAKAGGHVRRPPWDIPGFGRVAVLDDATGATQAWITPTKESQS